MMAARIVCPRCKSQGRLIRMTETEDGEWRCSHCERIYAREEIATIYENAARSFAGTVAKLKGRTMQELYISPDAPRYPNKVPTRILTATLLVALAAGCFLALGMARPVGTLIREVLR